MTCTIVANRNINNNINNIAIQNDVYMNSRNILKDISLLRKTKRKSEDIYVNIERNTIIQIKVHI